jgi:hypothetical protein
MEQTQRYQKMDLDMKKRKTFPSETAMSRHIGAHVELESGKDLWLLSSVNCKFLFSQ